MKEIFGGLRVTHESERRILSNYGIAMVQNYVTNQTRLYPTWRDFSWDWLVERGEYRGKLPARVSAYIARLYNIKLTPEQLDALGTLAANHLLPAGSWTFDFNQTFDWEAGDFGDEGSCYWEGRAAAREMLKRNGAYALRFFWSEGTGQARSWLVPTNFGHILFNGYGKELIDQARVLADWHGAQFRNIELRNRDADDGVLWINGGRGYVITDHPDEVPYRYDFQWPDLRWCENCRNTIVEGKEYYCDACLEILPRCHKCNEIAPRYHLEGQPVCYDCLCRTPYDSCSVCDEFFSLQHVTRMGRWRVCPTCQPRMQRCEHCNEWMHPDVHLTVDGQTVCRDCYWYAAFTCECCDTRRFPPHIDWIGHHWICDKCH